MDIKQEFDKLVAMIRADEQNRILSVIAGFPGGDIVHETPKKKRYVLAKKPKKGAKRSPVALAALTTDLFDFIKKNKGLRIEQIALKMQVTSKELTLPVQKLFAEKKIRTTGNRRATRYFAK